MKESCVCCQAVVAKASGVKANVVLLFTLADGTIPLARVIDALCEEHSAQLDSMIYRSLVPHVKHALRVKARPPLPLPTSPRKRKRTKTKRSA